MARLPKNIKPVRQRRDEGLRQRREADEARKSQIRRWVEIRPRSHREQAGRDDKHPRKGHKSDWEKVDDE